MEATSGNSDDNLIGNPHDSLILGWELTPTGEVWLVKLLLGGSADEETTIQVPFGKCAVEDLIVAPVSSFENVHWEGGPYFPRSFDTEASEWREFLSISMFMSSSIVEFGKACKETWPRTAQCHSKQEPSRHLQ